MSTKELQKRNSKTDNLRVLQTEDGSYFVESSKGKMLYNVVFNKSEKSCTCTDFAKNAKKNSEHQCKHILAVSSCVSNHQKKLVRSPFGPRSVAQNLIWGW